MTRDRPAVYTWQWLLYRFLMCWSLSLASATQDTSVTSRHPVKLSGGIKSHNFPHSCCVNETLTIYLPDGRTGHIQLFFEDLDLPAGTVFRIFQDEEGRVMYRNQPDFKFGVWQRPFITSVPPNNVIKLMLIEARDTSYNKSHYAGFKASYFEAPSPRPPKQQHTTELCQQVTSVTEGDTITIKPQPIRRFHNLMLDCIWVLKRPPVHAVVDIQTSNQSVPVVYIKIDAFPETGTFVIRRGASSVSPELEIPVGGRKALYVATSNNGFYISAIARAADPRNRIQFSYGLIHQLKEASDQCAQDEFRCHPPYPDWCLPQSYRCNKVDNCPLGEDENNCLLEPSTTFRPTTTTARPTTTTARPVIAPTAPSVSTTTTAPCQYPWRKQCNDGRCLLFQSDCLTSIGKGHCNYDQKYCGEYGQEICISRFRLCPGECDTFERRCNDGTCKSSNRYCPEVSCESYRPHRCGDQCYSDSDKCDGKSDCSDGLDEDYCFDQRNRLFFMLIVPLAFFVICFLTLKFRKKSLELQTRMVSSRDATRLSRVTGSTPSDPLLRNTRAITRGNTGTAQDSQPQGASGLDRQESLSAPPPTYEEVTTTENYPIPTGNTEPPPPSYESAVQQKTSSENV